VFGVKDDPSHQYTVHFATGVEAGRG
jgi:hypothetical protein